MATSTTANYGLALDGAISGKSVTIETTRQEQWGEGTSNMIIIDGALKSNADSVTNLKGVGYVAETVKGNADNIAALKQKGIYTAIMSGTNTLSSTVADLTTVPANTTLRIVPSAKNTTNVTVSINSETALPLVKVRNISGSTVYTALESGDLQPNMPVFISKTADGIRYVVVGFGETYSRNVFYDNGDTTFTNLQTKIGTIKTEIGTLSSLLTSDKTSTVNAINEVRTENRTTPTETTISSGFSSGWTGSIVWSKSLNGKVILDIDLVNNIDISTGLQLLYTLPVGIRPISSKTKLLNLSTNASVSVANSFANIEVSSDGSVYLTPVTSTTLTNARYVRRITIEYYAA